MEHKKGFNMSAGVKHDEVEVRIKYFLADTAEAGVTRSIRRIINVIHVLVG